MQDTDSKAPGLAPLLYNISLTLTFLLPPQRALSYGEHPIVAGLMDGEPFVH